MPTVREIEQFITFPKFWLWGELFWLRPWYSDGLLMLVDSGNPEYSFVRGEHKEQEDVWYLDPDGGGVPGERSEL